jgi:hypothetical protein
LENREDALDKVADLGTNLKRQRGDERGAGVEGEGLVGGEEDGLDLVPVVLDVDATTLREADSAAEAIGDDVEVELAVMGQEGLHYEGRDGRLATAHLHLDAETLVDKVDDLSEVEVERHEAALATLAEEHVGLDDELHGGEPGVGIKQSDKVGGVCDLHGEDAEVEAGEALEVLLEQPFGIKLTDLLPRHGFSCYQVVLCY